MIKLSKTLIAAKIIKLALQTVQIIMGKGENAGNQHFLNSLWFFLKPFLQLSKQKVFVNNTCIVAQMIKIFLQKGMQILREKGKMLVFSNSSFPYNVFQHHFPLLHLDH